PLTRSELPLGNENVAPVGRLARSTLEQQEVMSQTRARPLTRSELPLGNDNVAPIGSLAQSTQDFQNKDGQRETRPQGYEIQPSNHNAVAAAIVQGRADWGMAIESVARNNGLGFVPYQGEQYDFAVPKQKRNSPAVQAFRDLLRQQETRLQLAALGFLVTETPQSDL
ncbi:MAG: hypothetical protein FJ267_08885, partial [Planctomycetes bacterium]|nr:hypothetical protein [Planctomycetota bacterium]